MFATEILKSVQFIVGQDGKPTAAILDMKSWNAFLEILEESDDAQLVRERLRNWRSKEGWTRWEDFDTTK